MEDNIIIKSFSTSLNDDIKAITIATSIGQQQSLKKIIILLSANKLYIMPENITKVSFVFKYNCIKEVLLDENKDNILQIKFDMSKSSHKFQSLTLYIEKRLIFLKELMCYYSTYYMVEYGLLNDFPLQYTKINIKESTGLNIHLSNNINSLYSDSNYNLIDKGNYCFLLFKGCIPGNDDNSFKYQSEEASFKAKIILKQYDPKPIDSLIKNENEMNLQSLLLLKVLRYLNDQEWYSFIFTKFENYIKKGNLSQDVAEWTGFRIELRTSKYIPRDPIIYNEKNEIINQDDEECLYTNKNYCFIILRRKYIPPFYDMYQDYILSLSSPYCLDEIPLPKVYNDLIDTISYSLHINNDCLVKNIQDYEKIILGKFEGLLLDHDSLDFFSKHLNINGSICLMHGMNYVYKLLFLIEQQLISRPTMQSNLKSTIQFLWIRMVEHFTSLIPNFNKDEYEKKLYHDDINTLINDFSLVINTSGSSPYYNKYKPLWDKKIWQYLSYCLNGSLTYEQFNFTHLIEFYLIIKNDLKQKLFEVKIKGQLIHLLNIDIYYYSQTTKARYHSSFDIGVLLLDSNTIMTIDYDEDLFNLLFENCLLADVLSLELKTFPLFIQKILQYTCGAKIPLIKAIVNYLKISTIKGLEIERKQMTILIPDIACLFNKIIENPFLGMEAGKCFLEFISSSSDRENRIELLKSGIVNTIIRCLTSPIQEVVNICFKLLNNLFKEIKNNLSSISNFPMILSEIITVLTSTFIPEEYYSIEIIINGIEIFNVLLINHQGIFQIEFNKLLEKFDFIQTISQYLLKSEYILGTQDNKVIIGLEREIYRFISLYYEENPNWKLMELSKKCFDKIMSKASQKYLEKLPSLYENNITEIGQLIIESIKSFLEAMLFYLESNPHHLTEILNGDQNTSMIKLLHQLSAKITSDIFSSLVDIIKKYKSALKFEI